MEASIYRDCLALSSRWVVLFILIFCVEVLYPQTDDSRVIENIESVIAEEVDWSTIQERQYSLPENETIGSIISDTLNVFCDWGVLHEQILSDFHFVDIDGDRDNDLIYNGRECPGIESESILIYINKDGRYQRVLGARGRILRVTSKEIITHMYPCCDLMENRIVVYEIGKDLLHESYGIIYFKSAYYDYFSEYKQMNPKGLKRMSDMVLHADADIFFVPLDTMTKNGALRNNRVGRTRTESPVVVYAALVDDANQSWHYCKISQKNIVSERNYKYPVLAWIKAK